MTFTSGAEKKKNKSCLQHTEWLTEPMTFFFWNAKCLSNMSYYFFSHKILIWVHNLCPEFLNYLSVITAMFIYFFTYFFTYISIHMLLTHHLLAFAPSAPPPSKRWHCLAKPPVFSRTHVAISDSCSVRRRGLMEHKTRGKALRKETAAGWPENAGITIVTWQHREPRGRTRAGVGQVCVCMTCHVAFRGTWVQRGPKQRKGCIGSVCFVHYDNTGLHHLI